MKKEVELRDLFIVLTFFLLNPFVGFLISVYKYISSEKNKKFIFFISIFYGTFGLIFLSNLTYDIRAHYKIFKIVSKQNENQFIEYLVNQIDFLIFIYYKILSYFTKNPRWIGFFSAMISYGIPFYLIVNFGHKNKLKKYEILLFLLLFLGVTPSYKFSGMRNFNAICLFSLGVYLLDVLKNKKGYIYLILSPLLHVSMLFVVVIYLISKRIKFTKFKVWISLIFSIFLLFFSKIILLNLLKLFPKYSRPMNVYIIGKHATSIAASPIIILIYYLFFFSIYLLFYFKVLKTKKLKGLNFYSFIVLYFPIISIFSFSKTMYIRYAGNIELLLILLLIFLYNEYLRNNKVFMIGLIGYSIFSYSLMTRIEYKTWNPRLVSSSMFGILKEAKRLNTSEYIRFRRKN